VTERKYMEQDFETVTRSFLNERSASVAWLTQLEHPKWENVYHHESLGTISVQRFLASWLAHDYLHLRQITKLKYDYLIHSTGEDVSYAGEW
jgi:hypothetical protein